MVHRRRSLFACFLVAVCPTALPGQAPPRDIFLVCGSQPNEPTVYFSGVMQGPATALQGFHNGFVAFLGARYGYKGAVGCAPANTAANAQSVLNARSTALRNQKKNVVETGWTEPAAMASALAAPTPVPPAKKVATATGGGVGAGSSGSAGSGGSELSSILGAVLGTGSGAGSSSGTTGGTSHGKAGAGTSGNSSNSGSSGDQSGAAQVASTLATVFSNKSSAGNSAGAPSAPDPDGLGSAEAQNTKLVVYGCGRRDTQVACVTELTNQNQKDTLLESGAIWKDTFIVDDRGDRHQRSNGFFLNVDGEQRSQLDITYGKAARFILMFEGIPAKVQKVALRSTAGGLDVEDISLVAPSTDSHTH